MAGALSYMGRLMRDRVRVRPGRPCPSVDVFEATVFHQTWRHRLTNAETRFYVCAFPTDAFWHGVNRLRERTDGSKDVRHMNLIESLAIPEPSAELIESVLIAECAEERKTRETTWKRRMEAAC